MERIKKWLSLVLALVLVLSYVPVNAFATEPDPESGSATVTVCFVPNTNWKEADAWFIAYYWDGDTNGMVKLTQDGFCYTGEIPEGYSNVIFVRKDPADTALDWNNVWNQTADLTLDASMPCFVLGDGWATTGTWTTCPPAYDYYLAGSLNGADVGIAGAANDAANQFVDGKVDVTLTADSYVCLGVQYGTSVIGNYMTESYVSSGNTANLYTDGVDKLFVPAGTYRFTLVHNADGSVTLSYGCPHNMTYHAAADASCTVDGNVAYYACSVCGDNFSDEDGTAGLDDVSVAAPGHTIQYVEAKEAACGVPGNLEHYYCAACDGYFTDADGENATTKEAVTVIKEHQMQAFQKLDPTCTEDGYTAYYKCDHCGGTFADAAGTTPVDPKLPASGHDYVNGFCENHTNRVYCDAYEPATLVTNENYTELGLSAGYVGYYAIGNGGQLYWFADKVDNENAVYGSANAVMIADVTITSDYYGTRYWNPIGSADAKYSGTFDGNGKAVRDLVFDDTDTDIVGLVAWLTASGTVKNVIISGDGHMKGNDTIGAIVAYNEGTVELCGNTRWMEGAGINVGGIVGVNHGTVRNCWNTGEIIGTDAGGIVGDNEPDAVVENCWSTGDLSGTNVGGIVGLHQSGATVRNCYTTQDTAIATALGAISDVEIWTTAEFGSGKVAYLLQKDQTTQVWGQNIDNGQTVQTVPVFSSATVYEVAINCQGGTTYSNTESTETPAHSYVNGFCANEANGVVCDAYQPATPVTADNYTELGLSADYVGYYAIQNAGNLYWFAEAVDNENAAYKTAKVVLTADITVNPDAVTAESTGLREWNPIGYGSLSGSFANFNGIFDGNNKQISGLYYNNTDSKTGWYIGLIAKTESDALVKNVTVTNSWFNGYYHVAGIVGWSEGTISGCVSEVAIGCVLSYTGGMTSWNAGTVTGCINRGTIVSAGSDGGIVGSNKGTVELCGNEGSISNNWCYAGGIVGNNAGIVRNCWNTGDVSVNNSHVGGIVGMNNSGRLLENCWSTGAVSCGGGVAGGIVGSSRNGIQKNCYSLMEPVGQIKDSDGTSTVENVEKVTQEQLASGEVAYLLRTRAAAGTDAWGQNIDNDQTVQTVPTFTGAAVYYGYADCSSTEAVYTNDSVSAEPVQHNYDNGFCTNELADGTVCDAYEPAVLVTADNRTELGLAESYIGYYAIQNAGNLYWFADKVDNENATYGAVNVVLTDNITVNSGTVTAYSGGLRVWNPIGWYTLSDEVLFSGTFDGNGKTVSGLYFKDETKEGAALITITGETALVKNVTLTNSYFSSACNSAGIVGVNFGTVTGCLNEATMGGEFQTGGIVGINRGTVELCGNTASLSSTERYIGGIAGENRGTIRNCWNTGNIASDRYFVGGITGANNSAEGAALVENCWSTGTVSGTKSTGGIAGAAWWAEGGITNCYSVVAPVGERHNTHPITNVDAATQAQFASGDVAYLLRTRAAEGTNVWGQDLDNGKTVQTVPTFTGADVYQVTVDCAGSLGFSNTDADKIVHNYDDNGFCVNENAEGGLCDAYEPAVLVTEDNYTALGLAESYIGYYAISNAGQLYWFAEKVDTENATYGSANAVLTADITINEGQVTASSTGLRQWTPIGDYNNQFGGTFDGNSKTVSGLYFNDTSVSNVGLVSWLTADGTVKNVTVTNSYIIAKTYAGAIAGRSYGVITGCVNHASVNTDGSYAAGIVGWSEGTVELCGNTGTIYSGQTYAGGIVARGYGQSDRGAMIRDCWNTGSISAKKKAVGGIVGAIAADSNIAPSSTVYNCWSTGSVGGADEVGGVAGKVWYSYIRNCYSVAAPVGKLDTGSSTRNTEQKTLAQFTSGEVAYLLRTRATGGTNVWGQDLDNGKTVQSAPTFTGAPVYYGYASCADTVAKYTNHSNASTSSISHDWGYTADGASITGECLNECGTDGGKITLVAPDDTVYDGTAKTVTVDGELTDFEVMSWLTYEGDRINAGTFTAYLTLDDGTQATLDVTITPKAITPTIEGVEESYVYTGSAFQPVITVKDGETVLTEGEDYDVTYGENTTAGDGTVTVTLKGNYSGSAEETFTITPKAITPTVEGLEDSYTYTGSAIQPTVTVKDGDKVLTEGTDYDVTYGSNTNVADGGSVKVTLKGNYEGSAEETFAITPKAVTPTVEGLEDSYTYTGSAIQPTVTVKDGETVLTEGVDYDITYGSNTNVADGGSVKVTLKGNYEGSAEETFDISAVVLGYSITGTTKTYDGTTAAPAAKIQLSGIIGSDNVEVVYTASFDSKNAGNRTIHFNVTGLAGSDAGNYSLPEISGVSGEITRATVTVTGTTVANKTYDGTTAAQVTVGTVTGIVNGEATVAASGVFASAASGEDIVVTVTYALEGTDAANYVLSNETEQLSASIVPADAEEIMKPLDGVTPENATSDDEKAAEDVKKDLEEALTDPALPEEQKKELEEALEDVQDILDSIDGAQKAVDDESVRDTLDVTKDNVKPEDREDLEKAKDVLEDALENFGDNYTDEENDIIQENIDRIEGALKSLDDVQAVEDIIAGLPETVEPDDEETVAKIEDAAKAYDDLSEHEKSLVDGKSKEKLEDLTAAAVAYKIIKGDGSKWTRGSTSGLSFTANGPYGKFTCIKIDGNVVESDLYTSAAGSTVITLNASYLEGMDLGKHTIAICYTDGEAVGTFRIVSKASSPATGDTANVNLWISMAIISLAAAATLIAAKKRYSL